MKVIIDIGLDEVGEHRFAYEPSQRPGSIDIPKPKLERWAAERAAYLRARARWSRCAEEIQSHLHAEEDGQAVEVVLATAKARSA